MLSLRLRTAGANYTVGPAAWIEFRGVQIFLEGRPEAIARYEGGGWLYSGKRCLVLECRTLLFFCFVDVNGRNRGVVGPRAVMSVRDRYVFAGRQRLAKLTPERGLWTRLNAGEGWPVVRIVPSLARTEQRSMPT